MSEKINVPKFLAELDRLFAESDIISLHCPLTNETKHIIATIKKMVDLNINFFIAI